MRSEYQVPSAKYQVPGTKYQGTRPKLWMITVLFTAFVIILCPYSSVESSAQAMTSDNGFLADFETPAPYIILNSESDDYAPSYDKSRGRLFITSERSGTAQQWILISDSSARLCTGTFNEKGRQRAFVSFGAGDEVVGVAFVNGERQSFPTIVTVPLDNGSLNIGHPIPSLQGDHFTSQPALSPDGTKLVIVSDKDGGEGGLDLWICDRLTNNVWSDPVQLSDVVNSSGDEISPTFISADTLVYASNGYGGKGGFDLFVVVLKDGAWQEPEPLVFFNTEFDESDLTVLEDWTVIFASNRPGGSGGLDIWVSRRRQALGASR